MDTGLSLTLRICNFEVYVLKDRMKVILRLNMQETDMCRYQIQEWYKRRELKWLKRHST